MITEIPKLLGLLRLKNSIWLADFALKYAKTKLNMIYTVF